LNSATKEIAHEWDMFVTFPLTSTKLAVSSKILSLASPVLRSLLDPLSHPNSPMEIQFKELSNDSQQALEAIFCVLHFRHECVTTKVSPDVLYEIATEARKLNLVRALGPWKEKGFREECRRMIVKSLGYDGNNEGAKGKKTETNTMLELISEARISAINSLLSVAKHFTNLYYSNDIKCRVYVTSVASTTTPNRAAIPSCDAGILGSLLIHYATIGIRPVPLPPYKGISVESLALAMKDLHCSVKVDRGHGGCSIIGQVARQVDEVLARVDRLDIWDT
ncbi:hypothetical protein B9Z19DRAFT_896671, partial [Tuber borchii]